MLVSVRTCVCETHIYGTRTQRDILGASHLSRADVQESERPSERGDSCLWVDHALKAKAMNENPGSRHLRLRSKNRVQSRRWLVGRRSRRRTHGGQGVREVEGGDLGFHLRLDWNGRAVGRGVEHRSENWIARAESRVVVVVGVGVEHQGTQPNSRSDSAHGRDGGRTTKQASSDPYDVTRFGH